MAQIPDEMLSETIETLERVGCQFQFCDGPTLEPVGMITCFVCDLLARLRVEAGRPPRYDDELTFDEAWRKRDARYMAQATGRAHSHEEAGA